MQEIEPEESAPRAVWGLAGTLLWGAFIGLVYVYAQVVGIGIYIGTLKPGADPSDAERLLAGFESHGLALSFGLFLSAMICLPLIAVVIRLKRGSSLRHYLALEPVRLATCGYWLLALCLLAIAFDLLLWLLGRPIVPEFAQHMYRSAAGAWPLWLAIVVIAPAVEEAFFRGFLFSGFAASFPGPAGATAVTALLWAAFHIQYDLLLIGYIFIVGLLLGWARHRSGSILLTFGLHAFMNLSAMLLTAFTLSA